MFSVRIRPRGREYLEVLDTGATISTAAKKTLSKEALKNTIPTAAIRMEDGHVVYTCGDCEVDVAMGTKSIPHRLYVMDTEAFDFVLATNFFTEWPEVLSFTPQAPYVLNVDHGCGKESVPLEHNGQPFQHLRVCQKVPTTLMLAAKMEDYQLLGNVLDQGPKELGYSREDLTVEVFASDKQHVLDLYCSKGSNSSYQFHWPALRIAYGNPRFSELKKVLTKVTLECSRMVLCSPVGERIGKMSTGVLF